MRIIRFKAEGIHGFLKFNIQFSKGLTFLTGINGSGKTSALNAMIALLSPDLAMLADLEYKEISIEVEHEGKKQKIQAESQEDGIILKTSDTEERFIFSKYTSDPDIAPYRQIETETEYYRDLLVMKASHPVLRSIASLPTPMFLGIDRRSSFGLGRVPAAGPSRQARFGRNIFSKTLSGSLAAAATLAENRYRDALIQAGRFGERLQREMLLGLLGSSNDSSQQQNSLMLPTVDDVREIQRVRRDMHSIADIMRLPVAEVQKRLIPLLDLLQSVASKIPLETDVKKIFSSQITNSPLITAIANWNANQSHLLRIKFISEKVANYNELRSQILASTNNYRDLVNQFLLDSGKSIAFGEDGYIGVEIDGVPGPKPILIIGRGANICYSHSLGI